MEVRKRFENDKLKKTSDFFNGAQLKYIAFISMLIDHVNNALITPFLNGKDFYCIYLIFFFNSGQDCISHFCVFYCRRIF